MRPFFPYKNAIILRFKSYQIKKSVKQSFKKT